MAKGVLLTANVSACNFLTQMTQAIQLAYIPLLTNKITVIDIFIEKKNIQGLGLLRESMRQGQNEALSLPSSRSSRLMRKQGLGKSPVKFPSSLHPCTLTLH